MKRLPAGLALLTHAGDACGDDDDGSASATPTRAMAASGRPPVVVGAPSLRG